MYFFGAITNSQVAINSGTVTQTMVKEFTNTYLGGRAQAVPEPQSTPVSGEFDLPHQPQPAATQGNAGSISAETFCRTYLPPMLDDLQRRLPELGLRRKTEQALRRRILGLRDELNRTPVDMKAVTAELDDIHGALRAAPRNRVSLTDDLRGAPRRGGTR
ncbi:hypothetical protein GCM10010515_71260 [Streptomyces fructofermentans]|uniref:Uncharacterized protein n=2 Tax=Streptomyces fructofermentans TaxID=152141 RepID=A0A918NTC6_9ACTN|nr:hypothetical protein GCM10010515_71260 [Streptomyces fructofermentans]